MRKIFFFSLLFLGVTLNSALAQTAPKMSPAATHTYYADIRNVSTKALCTEVLETVRAKAGVVFFETEQFPSKYFILKTSVAVSESSLKSWLAGEPVQLVFFDEGDQGKERLIVNKRKHP